jgi:hypothetical protein
MVDEASTHMAAMQAALAAARRQGWRDISGTDERQE